MCEHEWKSIESAPKGKPIIVFGPTLIDEDYNPDGIVEAFWTGEENWAGAIWNNEQDCYDLQVIAPTHWLVFTPPVIALAEKHDKQ